MKKERKQYILDFVRKVANSEQIGGDTRKELHAICEEVGVDFRDTICDNCCRDAAVQVYQLLKTKGTKRVSSAVPLASASMRCVVSTGASRPSSTISLMPL